MKDVPLSVVLQWIDHNIFLAEMAIIAAKLEESELSQDRLRDMVLSLERQKQFFTEITQEIA